VAAQRAADANAQRRCGLMFELSVNLERLLEFLASQLPAAFRCGRPPSPTTKFPPACPTVLLAPIWQSSIALPSAHNSANMAAGGAAR
jgi:hypothetical protein